MRLICIFVQTVRRYFVLMASFPLWALAFFRGPELLVPLACVALVFLLTGTTTVARTLGGELFPTHQRGTAAGWLQLSEALGRIGGLALIDWSREHRPRLRVVVMTAYGSPTIKELSVRKGAVLYLEKPVDPRMLVELLK